MQLRDASVEYVNGLGAFVDQHTVEVTEWPSGGGGGGGGGDDGRGGGGGGGGGEGEEEEEGPRRRTLSAARFIVATGGRPAALGCPGAELAISSDDLFSLPASPGKTLLVGGGYVALECAGFLTALGFDTTVLARSVLLRGFDHECVERIGADMERHGTKMVRGLTPAGIAKQVKRPARCPPWTGPAHTRPFVPAEPISDPNPRPTGSCWRPSPTGWARPSNPYLGTQTLT